MKGSTAHCNAVLLFLLQGGADSFITTTCTPDDGRLGRNMLWQKTSVSILSFDNKCIPVLNSTPLHEDIQRSGDIIPEILKLDTGWR
jgi:hypothetical protein